ncbi:MAG: hypothetical protein E7K48_02595, partial [Varibaculum cambriense]|nr:hypothetical protein [Varibaculum cambriense]
MSKKKGFYSDPINTNFLRDNLKGFRMKMFRSGEVVALDLSRGRRVMLLVLVSMASSMIYLPPYMKIVFYDPLMKALNCTNADLGVLMSAYATTALICYLPSGIVADKFRMRTL